MQSLESSYYFFFVQVKRWTSIHIHSVVHIAVNIILGTIFMLLTLPCSLKVSSIIKLSLKTGSSIRCARNYCTCIHINSNLKLYFINSIITVAVNSFGYADEHSYRLREGIKRRISCCVSL